MVVVFLTLLSFLLTLLVGALLLLGVHRAVTLVVRYVETHPTYSDDARRTLRSLAVRRSARR